MAGAPSPFATDSAAIRGNTHDHGQAEICLPHSCLNVFGGSSAAVPHREVLVMFSGIADVGVQDATVWLPLGIAGLLSWSLWLYRRIIAHRLQPCTDEFSASVSVVVPVFREDPEILDACITTWLAESVAEVILVVDTADTDVIEMVRARSTDRRLRLMVFEHQGKRSAMAVGVKAATSEIVIFVDSDTAWTPGLVTEIIRPFSDPAVGGVGSRQLVAAAQSSLWRRVASWLLDIRFLDYVPAMGARGSVACLSGRTAAYRRAVIAPLMPHLEFEYFLGRLCIAGDDGRLTWLVLANGYRTVHQSTAIAYSMFPETLSAFVKQRVRWTRNSMRCYTTAAYNGWLWDQPFITQVTVLQNIFTPCTMAISMAFLVFTVTHFAWWIGALYVAWVVFGRGLRGLSHLQLQPREIVILPVIVVVTIGIALPIKLYAIFTMNKQGWLTRNVTQTGGEGQSHQTLAGSSVVS